MTWPLSKLDTINQCLALTANALVSAVDDGSDEWNVGSAAWEVALEALFEEHDWNFLTNVQVLQRAGAPTDPHFADAYAKPLDCMHVIWVRLAMSVGNDAPVEYQILNNQIVLNAAGYGPPVAPTAPKGVVTLKYISNQNGPETFTPLFMAALRAFVKSGIYEGFEDKAAADSEWQKGMSIVAQARSRSDQQAPKHRFYNSRMRMTRRVRHPWGVSPLGWTDTGRPQ